MDQIFTMASDDPDHETSSSINCDLDFLAILEENPIVFKNTPLNGSQPVSDFQLEIDDFLKSLVSNNEPTQKKENVVNGEPSLRHIDLASENSKLKMIIKKLQLKYLKQESKFAECESNLAEKWSALDFANKELKTMIEKCEILEIENSTLKNNLTQCEVQINQYSYMKLEKDIVDEKLSALEKETKLHQNHIKRLKGRNAKNYKELSKMSETLKKKDQHIQDIWKMILAVGTNHKKTKLTIKEKNKLKKEYVQWFPSEITQNTGKVEDAIDNLKDMTSSLFKELTTTSDPEDTPKVTKSTQTYTNKEHPNNFTSSLLSPKEKVSSSDDSPVKTEPILQDKFIKRPTTRNKEITSIKNTTSHPCSPDTLSHENVDSKMTSSAIYLHQDASFTNNHLNVKESPSQQLTESLFSASNIDNGKEQSLAQISYSVSNTKPLVEIKALPGNDPYEELSNQMKQVDSPLEVKPMQQVKGSDCALPKLLLEDITLSNDSMSILDPKTGELSDAENLNDDWHFNFNEADDDQDLTQRVTSLMEVVSSRCNSTEPVIENLALPGDNTVALNVLIPKVPFKNDHSINEKTVIDSLKKDNEIVREEKASVSKNVLLVSDDLETSSRCVSTKPIESIALYVDNTLNGSIPFKSPQYIEKKESVDPLKKHNEVIKEEKVSNGKFSFESDELENTLDSLEKYRQFFSIPKRPLSPFPPTPPKVKLQTESLKEEVNSECNNKVVIPTKSSSTKSKTLKENHTLQSLTNHSSFDESSANSCEISEYSYCSVEHPVDAVSTEYYGVDHKHSKECNSTIVSKGAVNVLYNKPFIKFVPSQENADNSCPSDSLPRLKSPVTNYSELETCSFIDSNESVETKSTQNPPANNSFLKNTHITGNSSTFLPIKNYNITKKSEVDSNTDKFNCMFSLNEILNKSEIIIKNDNKSSTDIPAKKMATQTLQRSANQLIENGFNEGEFKTKNVNIASELIELNNQQKILGFAANVHMDSSISIFQPEPLKSITFDKIKKASTPPMNICQKNQLKVSKQNDSTFQNTKKRKIILEEQTSSTAPVRIRGRTKLGREIIEMHNVQTENEEETKEKFENSKESNSNHTLANEDTAILEESISELNYVSVHKPKKIRIEHRKSIGDVKVIACKAEIETNSVFCESLKDKESASPKVPFEEKHLDTASNFKTPKQINVNDFSPIQSSTPMEIEHSTPSDFRSAHKEREGLTCVEDLILSIRNSHPQRTLSIDNKYIETNTLMTSIEEDDNTHISNTTNTKSCDVKENQIKNSLVCKENISDPNNNTLVTEQHLKASKVTSDSGYCPQFQKRENKQKIAFPKTNISLRNEGHSSTFHPKPSGSQTKNYGKKRVKEHITHKLNMKKSKGKLNVQKVSKQKCALVSIDNSEKSSSILLQGTSCPREKSSKKLLAYQLCNKKRKIMKKLRIQSRKCTATENPLEKLFQNDQLCQENFKHIVHSVVRFLINPSNSPNKAALLFHVIDYLRNSEKSPLLMFLSSEDPSILLPFEENCIVVALFRIELKKKTHLDGLVETAVTTLHNIILSKKFSRSGLASLCRVFTELCKRKENSLKPVMLCAELLKTKHRFSSYLVASVAGVWKDLFQIENNISVEEKLLHSSILYGAKQKPKGIYGIYWNSSINIISKFFNAPPVKDARPAMHILKNFIESKCQSVSWNSQYMTSALTILAVYENWDWVQENLLDEYILPHLVNFGKTTLNEAAFDLYCNLYVDIYFLKPGVFSIDIQLSNIYNHPKMWQGEFVNDSVALALTRLVFLKSKPLPSFLSSWFESNHQKPKVQENAVVFNTGLMHANPTELKVEEIQEY